MGLVIKATPQPLQLQHVARSQLLMRASAHVTMFPSGIAQQLSEIDGYYSGQSTGMEEKETGDRDHIQELSDEDDDQEEGHGDSSAKYGEEGEMEDERAVH